MNKEFSCPYCGQSSYAKTSKKQGRFTSWDAVIRHLPRCSQNNHSFVVLPEYGVVPLQEIINTSAKELHIKYPNSKIYTKLKALRKSGSITTLPSLKIVYSKDTLVRTIQEFVEEHGRIPAMREFKGKYPAYSTVVDIFGSWNAAIEAAGFIPNLQNGFGIDTYGKDGYLYRSKAEAYFADTYLYSKYEYIIEPKYPEPHNRYYDWYIPSLDLYIELDGGIRPKVITEKIAINRLLSRRCLFIQVPDIYTDAFVLP